MTLSTAQRGVLRGIVLALAITVAVLAAAVALPNFPRPATADVGGRLAFVAAWDLLVVFWLLLAIGTLARHRFFHAEDIDGSGLTAGSAAARHHQAVLQNTLEQVVLAVAVHAACAILFPAGWLAALPAAAVLFALGRVLFWRGYRQGAAARALGFGLTFYPTALLFLAAVAGIAAGA